MKVIKWLSAHTKTNKLSKDPTCARNGRGFTKEFHPEAEAIK